MKKIKAKSSKTVLFGLHSILMVLQKKADQIETLYIQQGRDDARIADLIRLADHSNLSVQRVEKTVLSELSSHGNHQGVVALLREESGWDEHDLFGYLETLKEPPFLLLLDGIQDPHNLGACLRSADAAGVHAVIIPKDRSVSLTPAVRKVACGAAETVPLVMVTNLVRVMEKLKKENIWLVGAAGEATDTLYGMDLKGGVAIVAGAEGDGLRRLTKETCDFLVKIPMFGSVSSLNVSVAVGILLFETVRQTKIS